MENSNSSFKTKFFVLLALAASILCVSVSYAALSTTLKISGSAVINSATWNIEIQNGRSSVVGDAVFKEPTVSATRISDFGATFTKPGDAVNYKFDIMNLGTLDGKLAKFDTKKVKCKSVNQQEANDVCSNITYSIKYADGSDIKANDELEHVQKKPVVLSLIYNYESTTIPSNPVTIDGLDVTFVYEQK